MRLRTQLLLIAVLLLLLPASSLMLFKNLELTWRAAAEGSLKELAEISAQQVAKIWEAEPTNNPIPVIATHPLRLDGYDEDWHSQAYPTTWPSVAQDPYQTQIKMAYYNEQLWLLLAWPAPTPETPLAGDLYWFMGNRQGRLARDSEGRVEGQAAGSPLFQGSSRWHDRLRFLELRLDPETVNNGFLLCADEAQQYCWLGKGAHSPTLPLWLEALPKLGGWLPDNSQLRILDAQQRPLFLLDKDPQRDIHSNTSLGRLLLGWLTSTLVPAKSSDSVEWALRSDWQKTRLNVRVPVWSNEGSLLGYVSLERRVSRLSQQADQSLLSSLWASWSAILLITLVLLAWASWLVVRIRRLQTGMHRSLNPDTNYQQPYQPENGTDEIAEVSRGFNQLLLELQAYAAYKEGFVAKLTHECRTPISIIKSSLNLARLAETPAEQQNYLQRAEEGCGRLSRLIQSLGEIPRLERLIDQYEHRPFKLLPLLQDLLPHYREVVAPHSLVLKGADNGKAAQEILGHEDLLVQALDKLLDNARSFATSGSEICLSLTQQEGFICLHVFNEGPALDPAFAGKAFEAYASDRTQTSRLEQAPHLGLGLAIVRLVMDFHHGRSELKNCPGGVEAVLYFPLA